MKNKTRAISRIYAFIFISDSLGHNYNNNYTNYF